MTNKNPAALRLAEDIATDAALEIRRLHEENERLLAANKDSSHHFDALMADHKKLQEVNQELLEALKELCNVTDTNDYNEAAFFKAESAIAKAEVTK
jgi:FtsZ-binding cell division protein ZapB